MYGATAQGIRTQEVTERQPKPHGKPGNRPLVRRLLISTTWWMLNRSVLSLTLDSTLTCGVWNTTRNSFESVDGAGATGCGETEIHSLVNQSNRDADYKMQCDLWCCFVFCYRGLES